MQSDTLKSRLFKLLQRSRQAYRLYSSMGRLPRGESNEFSEMQAAEWRTVNADLVKQLSALLEAPNSRNLHGQIVAVAERLLADFRHAEADLHIFQRDLIAAAEKGDFVRAAGTGKALVSLKARVQALQAAHHELDHILSHILSQGGRATPAASHDSALVQGAGELRTVELRVEDEVPPEDPPELAKIIPLRQPQHLARSRSRGGKRL